MGSMTQESCRLETFAFWPLDSPVKPSDLATAGFYYTGFADRVKCAFCHGELEHWVHRDVPAVEHQRYFPACEFVMGLSAYNIQDGGSCLRNILQERGVPAHHDYEDETVRVRSFTNWPKGKTQTPLDLARAGFFYEGHGDSVRCFFCGVGLRNWEDGDDPWTEHARWRSSCPHINSVSAQHNNFQNPFGRNVCETIDTTSFPVSCTEESPFPQYENVDRRMASFQNLQLVTIQPKRLATAGFFFEVETHTVRCYRCGLVLTSMNWNQSDVFAVHERESPKCQHISNLPNICLDVGIQPDQNLPRYQVQQLLLQVTGPTTDDDPGTNENYVTGRGFLDGRNRMLEEHRCRICRDESANMVFLPCGHIVCCTGCSIVIRQCLACGGQVWARVKALWE